MLIHVDNIWLVDSRFWPFDDSNDSTNTKPYVVLHCAAAAAVLIIDEMGHPTWVKCDFLAQNCMIITAIIRSKLKLKRTENEKLLIGRTGV